MRERRLSLEATLTILVMACFFVIVIGEVTCFKDALASTDHPAWDINQDGITDISDITLVGGFFGETVAAASGLNPDVNGDGKVDILDFVLVGQHFGETHLPMRMNVYYQDGWPQVIWGDQRLTRTISWSSVSITVDDRSVPRGSPMTSDSSRALYRMACGELVDSIQRVPEFPNCVKRRLAFENSSDTSCDLTWAEFRVAIAADENAPHWQAQSFVMVECTPGGPTLCTGFTSDEDLWHCELSVDQGFTAIYQCHQTAWRLQPGEQAYAGTQYIWVVDGDLATARASAQEWYDAVGLTVADNGPDWFRDCIMYEACAGGSLDSLFSDVGGFDNFARQLDYIADLGCNAFWLMSVLTHKIPESPGGGWNLYDPMRFDEIDPAYGGEESLTRLVEAMRDRDFRIINEIVPHGGYAPLCVSHPEWWTYKRDGERQLIFGQSLDYSSPDWQKQIKETIRWLTAGWGLDGYRVDVANGFGPNWKSPANAPHFSLSTMAGSIGMLRAIREGALEGGADAPAIIPEDLENRPEYARYGQVGYGFRLIFFLEEEKVANLSPERLRDILRDHFERERGSLPRGMVSLRAINNHDTINVWGRADRRFGLGLQQALTAVCTVVEGVPMLYQEQEVGSYHFFRRLFWARRRVPEMSRGTPDYIGVKSPPSVFAVLRSIGDSHALGLVNLSWEQIDGEIQLPEHVAPAEGATLYDAISERTVQLEFNSFQWHFEPYEAAILRVGRPPEGEIPPERHQQQSVSTISQNAPLNWELLPQGAKFSVAGIEAVIDSVDMDFGWEPQTDGSIVVSATAGVSGEGELSIRMTGIDRWSVESVTGVYEDRLMRRHYPWPEESSYSWEPDMLGAYEPFHLYRNVLPAGRQWQASVAPLHPQDGRIAFAGSGRGGIALSGIKTNAMNIVLTDRSEEPEPEPYGLTLRFLANDEHLNPDWVPGYRHSFWTEIPGDPLRPPNEPLTVAFTLSPLSSFVETIAYHRIPDAASSAQEIIGPGKYTRFLDRLWLTEPNTVTWEKLPLKHEGDYTLWIQLRHSERGPRQTELHQHYKMHLDGKPLSFTWAKLDVWHTGNGYFGWARANVGQLEAGVHSLTIETTQTWLALLPQAYVSREPSFVPWEDR